MIILDDQDSDSQQTRVNAAGRIKFGPTTANSDTATARQGSAPSYIQSHSNTPPPRPPPPYSQQPHSYQRTTTPLVSEYPPSPARRFWTAFVLAFIIYFVLVGTTQAIIFRATHRMFNDDGDVGAPQVSDGDVLRSIGSLNWTSYQSRPRWADEFSHSAETSFTLPIASDELYLISRGSYQVGKVELAQATEDGDVDVKVNVRVAYYSTRALARSTICLLRRGGNKNGIGIFTPTPGWHSGRNTDRLHFEVTIIFPMARPERAPLLINRFTSHTSNFAHEAGDLWQTMFFSDIELRTANGHIDLTSITVGKGSMTSSNGNIIGHFNSSDSLVLHTSNGHIRASADLLNTGGNAATLDMRTSNGQINSRVSLRTMSGSGGKFDVKARTSNGRIDLVYDDSPLKTHLASVVGTSNGPVSVKMHPAFEGSFEVSTSNSSPRVHESRPTDPSGAGRHRCIVKRNDSRSMISGSVYWGAYDGRGRTSSSTMQTSNSPAELIL